MTVAEAVTNAPAESTTVRATTFSVGDRKPRFTPNSNEELLRLQSPPVVARIREDTVLLDTMPVWKDELKSLADCMGTALVE